MGSLFSKRKTEHGRDWHDGVQSRNANSNSSTCKNKSKMARSDILRNVSNNRCSRRNRLKDRGSKLLRRARFHRDVHSDRARSKLNYLDKVKTGRSLHSSSKRNRNATKGKLSEPRSFCRLSSSCSNRRYRVRRTSRRSVARSRKGRRDTRTNRRRKVVRKQKEGRRQRKRRANKGRNTYHRRQVLKPVYGLERHIEKVLTPQETIISKNLDRGLDDVKADPLSVNELCRSLVKSMPGIPADDRNPPAGRKKAKPELERDNKKRQESRKNKRRRRCKRSTRKVGSHKAKTTCYSHTRRSRKKGTARNKKVKHEADSRDSSPRYMVSKAYRELSKMVKDRRKKPGSRDRDEQLKNRHRCYHHHNNVCCHHHRKLTCLCHQICKQGYKSHSESNRPRRCCCNCHKQNNHKFKSSTEARSQRRRKTEERSHTDKRYKGRRKK